MSGWINSAVIPPHRTPDKRLLDSCYTDGLCDPLPPLVGLSIGMGDGLGMETWATAFWPTRGDIMSDAGSVYDILSEGYEPEAYPCSGTNGRLSFAGVTRDQYGSPLGGCTVRCFRTATAELMSQVTSDPSTGDYIATTPYYEAHFLTIHKTAPNVAGASLDTVLPE